MKAVKSRDGFFEEKVLKLCSRSNLVIRGLTCEFFLSSAFVKRVKKVYQTAKLLSSHKMRSTPSFDSGF